MDMLYALKQFAKNVMGQFRKKFWNYFDNRLEDKLRKLIPQPLLTIETHVAEHCNLNCAYCDNFSPLAEEEYADIDVFSQDMARLSELCNGEIMEIKLVGGEPLLNNRIEEFFEVARRFFPVGIICVITNGILLLSKSKEFWDSCNKNNIWIYVTKYPITFNYDAAEQLAKEQGVTYRYFNNAAVTKTMMQSVLDPSGEQNPVHSF